MDFDWVREFLENEAPFHSKEQGYYNDNYVVIRDNVPYIVRVPIPKSDTMDLRPIPEAEVLHFLEENAFPAPRLLYQGPGNEYYIHSYVEGDLVNDLFYDDSLLPDWYPLNIASQVYEMHGFETDRFAPYCEGIALSPQSSSFYLAMLDFVSSIYRLHLDQFMVIYEKLGIPDEPLEGLRPLHLLLRDRGFVFAHCDIHRKNLIFNRMKNTLTVLDWELVLITDPVYDITVHFHKMRYSPSQEEQFLTRYLELGGMVDQIDVWSQQIATFRKLEQVKSALVDCIRCYKDINQEGMSRRNQLDSAVRYFRKLDRAWDIWGVKPGRRVKDPEALLELMTTESL